MNLLEKLEEDKSCQGDTDMIKLIEFTEKADKNLRVEVHYNKLVITGEIQEIKDALKSFLDFHIQSISRDPDTGTLLIQL